MLLISKNRLGVLLNFTMINEKFYDLDLQVQRIQVNPALSLTDLNSSTNSSANNNNSNNNKQNNNNINSDPEGKVVSVTKRKKYNVVVIDRVFRSLAPIVYIIFCIIYFSYFNRDRSKSVNLKLPFPVCNFTKKYTSISSSLYDSNSSKWQQMTWFGIS